MFLNVKIPQNFISENDLKQIEPFALHAYKLLTEKMGEGNEFTGWLTLPEKNLQDASLLENIIKLKERQNNLKIDTLIFVGIGGSYLGTRAVHAALTSHQFNHEQYHVLYMGHHLEPIYYSQAMKFLEDKHPLIVVISKSGTTTEPAIAFRLLRNWIEKKFPTESAQRIVAITDEKKGALRKLAQEKGYTSFVIPNDVGGRYSVLTSVGLVPLALLHVDILELLKGAFDMQKLLFTHHTLNDNPAMYYASLRHTFLMKGRPVEVLATFYPQLFYLGEWWKQLFGESEGKNNKGIFPTTLFYTTDLHSMGQYIQEGSRIMFETILSVENSPQDLVVPTMNDNLDELQYLEGKNLAYINQKAEEGTIMAHVDGHVPVIQIKLPQLNAFELGSLMYFFEFACGISSYMFHVNPFNQPGVEAYKQNMYKLLGKI